MNGDGSCMSTSPNIPLRSGRPSRWWTPFHGIQHPGICCVIGTAFMVSIWVHYIILTSRPLEDPTVVGWQETILSHPTCGGVPDGHGSRDLLGGNQTGLCQAPSPSRAACIPG